MNTRLLGRAEHSEVFSAVNSLKQLVTIISGLAATNAVLQLVLPTSTNAVFSLRYVSLRALALFGVSILTIVRFYHGNMRHLDASYLGGTQKGGRRRSQRADPAVHSWKHRAWDVVHTALDFLVVFAEALILVVLSFLLFNPREFVAVYVALLVIDVIWFVILHKTTSAPWAKAYWVNNIAFLGVLVVPLATLGTSSQDFQSGIFWYVTLMSGNTIVDFVINARFFFPPPGPSDVVEVARFKLQGKTGITERERSQLQDLIISVDVLVDAREAAARDDISKTVDYEEVRRAAERVVLRTSPQLMETLAEAIARELLKSWKLLEAVNVRIEKPGRLPDVEFVAVEILRNRLDLPRGDPGSE